MNFSSFISSPTSQTTCCRIFILFCKLNNSFGKIGKYIWNTEVFSHIFFRFIIRIKYSYQTVQNINNRFIVATTTLLWFINNLPLGLRVGLNFIGTYRTWNSISIDNNWAVSLIWLIASSDNFSVVVNPLVIMMRRYWSANVEYSGKRREDDVERRCLNVQLNNDRITRNYGDIVGNMSHITDGIFNINIMCIIIITTNLELNYYNRKNVWTSDKSWEPGSLSHFH